MKTIYTLILTSILSFAILFSNTTEEKLAREAKEKNKQELNEKRALMIKKSAQIKKIHTVAKKALMTEKGKKPVNNNSSNRDCESCMEECINSQLPDDCIYFDFMPPMWCAALSMTASNVCQFGDCCDECGTCGNEECVDDDWIGICDDSSFESGIDQFGSLENFCNITMSGQTVGEWCPTYCDSNCQDGGGDCVNDDSTADNYGDYCSDMEGNPGYDSNPSWCGNYDTETFSAAEQCCVCGGGSISGPCDDESACNNGEEGDCEYLDCNDECGGTAVLDCLGVCGGTEVEDCAGVCGGTAVLDVCGDCDGGVTETYDCPDNSCSDDYCPEGQYWDGSSCYSCSYCMDTNDDSACSAESGNDCCGACGGSASGDCGDTSGGTTGGGEVCEDTNNGSTASDGSACCWETTCWNGNYDDDDCDEMAMCCACGGGNVGPCSDENACNYGSDDSACEYLDCLGECGGSAVEDCNGECGGTAIEDCAGVCGGISSTDDCGVCDGDNSTCLDCAGTPNGTAMEDCEGVCEGTAATDACGVCNGDGSACAGCSNSSWYDDNYCDDSNNTAECNYDGGDCCPGDCETGGLNNPGYYDCADDAGTCEDCIDPNSADNAADGECFEGIPGCTDDTALNYDEDASSDDGSCAYNCSDLGVIEYDYEPDTLLADCDGQCFHYSWGDDYLADGSCDDGENETGGVPDVSINWNCEEYNYDDCDCGDLGTDCPELDPCQVAGGLINDIADAYCDSVNNNEACGYDGGDCCPTSCASIFADGCPDNDNGCYSTTDEFCGDCGDCDNPNSMDNSSMGACGDLDSPPAATNLSVSSYWDDNNEDGLANENDDFGLAFTWDHEDYSIMVDCNGEDVPAWYTTYVGDGICNEMFYCEEHGFDGDDCNEVNDEDESFEGEALPEGWSSTDADADGNDWFLYPHNPHSGVQSIASASWTSTSGPLNPDNWLISPSISLLGGEELRFWAAAQDPAWPSEHYSVMLSTSGTDISDFTVPLFEETIQDSAWHEVVLDLNDFSGETVHIAWRHHDVTDMFYMKLDDISVSGSERGVAFNADFESKSDYNKFKSIQLPSTKFGAVDLNTAIFDIANGTHQSMIHDGGNGVRYDYVTFELNLTDGDGVEYVFATNYSEITIIGFADGEDGCGNIVAISNEGLDSDPTEEVCDTAGEDSCPTAGTGDSNTDGSTDIQDIVLIVSVILGGSFDDDCNTASADINSDGSVDIQDIVGIVAQILGNRHSTHDATSGKFIRNNNSLLLESNGYVGGIQMTLNHGADFQITLTEDAMLSDYNTVNNTTTLVIVKPESDELFTFNGNFKIMDVIAASNSGRIAIQPAEITLSDAYPNPFNPTTNMALNVTMAGHVSVEIYNLMGQLVATLQNGYLEANTHLTLEWNASDMTSGMYLVKAQTANYVTTQKLMFLK